MAEFVDRQFKDRELQLDGNVYKRCSFDDCKLIFSGGLLPIMDGCTFGNNRWNYAGAADRTLLYLRSLYHAGEGFRTMIDQLFDDIRHIKN